MAEKKRALDESNETHATTKMYFVASCMQFDAFQVQNMQLTRIHRFAKYTQRLFRFQIENSANAMCIRNLQSLVQRYYSVNNSASFQARHSTKHKYNEWQNMHTSLYVRVRERKSQNENDYVDVVAYVSIFDCIMHEVATIAASSSTR